MKIARRIMTAIVVITAVLGAAAGVSNYLLRQKVKKFDAHLREIRIGIEGEFVDNCGEMPPIDHNYLPLQLTTPIQYIKPELRPDPFSRNGEPLRYFNQPAKGNGTFYVVASVGPDKVLDTHFPQTRKLLRPLPPDPVPQAKVRGFSVKATSQSLNTNGYFEYREDVEYIIWADGSRLDNTTITVEILPDFDRTKAYSASDIVTYLLKTGSIIYDPTNGLRSRGDIITHNFN